MARGLRALGWTLLIDQPPPPREPKRPNPLLAGTKRVHIRLATIPQPMRPADAA